LSITRTSQTRVIQGRAMKRVLLAVCLCAVQAAAAGMNIVELAEATPGLSTLVTALKAGGLTGELSLPGPFTVFAPSNVAFLKLPNATLSKLLSPGGMKDLDSVLEYHIIPGASIFAADLKPNQTVKTLEGESLSIEVAQIDKQDTVQINGAPGLGGSLVITKDINATNGVVHIIDTVLDPAAVPIPENHLWFHLIDDREPGTKWKSRCGEVDAATRMPAVLFEPQYKAILDRYVSYTLKHIFWQAKQLKTGRCSSPYKYKGGKEGLPWAPPVSILDICYSKCNCTADPERPCKDQPDQPAKQTFCSLCGPTMNAPVDIQLYYSTPQEVE